jgi:two-component system aerobic respiration control sensor histidine kinase ArcB
LHISKEPENSKGNTSTAAPIKRSQLPKILLVDDEPDVILTLRKGLEERGFSVDTYNDPLLALSNFKSSYYDLLLFDVKMAKMNGFELYQKIKKKDKNVKACFITAHQIFYESLKKEFPKIRVDCFLTKPIEIEDLVRKVKDQLKSVK